MVHGAKEPVSREGREKETKVQGKTLMGLWEGRAVHLFLAKLRDVPGSVLPIKTLQVHV